MLGRFRSPCTGQQKKAQIAKDCANKRNTALIVPWSCRESPCRSSLIGQEGGEGQRGTNRKIQKKTGPGKPNKNNKKGQIRTDESKSGSPPIWTPLSGVSSGRAGTARAFLSGTKTGILPSCSHCRRLSWNTPTESPCPSHPNRKQEPLELCHAQTVAEPTGPGLPCLSAPNYKSLAIWNRGVLMSKSRNCNRGDSKS